LITYGFSSTIKINNDHKRSDFMSLSPEWIDKAKEIAGSAYVLTSHSDLTPYSHDELAMDSYNRLPEAVVRPQAEEEIAEIVKLCSTMKVPLTVRGGGTGLSAACVPSFEGVILSMDRLNKLIDADENNHTITVQAGMPLYNLYREVERMGLYFPPHPGDEGAFAGGVVATNAGGARAVKYGTVKRFVLGLRVILANGSIIELGGKFIKISSGYDLLNLMISSEGTLGVITEVTFSLLPKPGAVTTIVVPFRNVAEAVETVPALLKANVIPAAVEFVEHSVMRCSEQLLNRKWPAQEGQASLMFILDGKDEDDVMTQAEQLSEIVESKGALNVLLAESKEKQAEILQMRSSLYEALRPGVAEIFDITVPRSEIANHVRFVHELEEEFAIILPTYGHAADGNVHSHYMHCALNDGIIGDELPDWKEKYKDVRTLLFGDALKRGGNISGEHGIGLAKKDILKQTMDAAKLNVMRSIKKALDPLSILNPGKILDM
jgi:glycolate oxidase